jgi:formate dehydrogenase subunit gamma
MEPRTITRFRKRAILFHWLFAVTFIVMFITGGIMFFDLTGMAGGVQIRLVHRVAAVFFVLLPVIYILIDPASAIDFLKRAFRWDRDALAWLRSSLRFYSGRKVQMPPQGYINGDQKLWQLIVITTGLVLALSGTVLWFFKLNIPLVSYQWVLLVHAASFVVVLFMFPVHFYLTTLHSSFEESLSSMMDGKVSASYAREHCRKWFKEKTGAK